MALHHSGVDEVIVTQLMLVTFLFSVLGDVQPISQEHMSVNCQLECNDH